MAGFLTPLDLRYVDGRLWEVRSSFDYCLGEPDGPERVLIPIGFRTDFASIPRVLWSLLPPTGSYGKAAVVHDFLYQRRKVIDVQAGTLRYVERGEADRIFLEAMTVLGVSALTRRTIYAGVRVGGWVAWRRARANENSNAG